MKSRVKQLLHTLIKLQDAHKRLVLQVAEWITASLYQGSREETDIRGGPMVRVRSSALGSTFPAPLFFQSQYHCLWVPDNSTYIVALSSIF